MSPKTKERLLIAGGIVGGAAVVFGAIALLGGDAKASDEGGGGGGGAVAPAASDSDIERVVQKALSVESDPATLRDLARFMLVIPWGNPLRNRVAQLQNRAAELEANRTNAGGETFQHIRQF